MTRTPIRGRPRDPEVSRRILAAALTEYSRYGWSAFTMDGVAREAGVGKAALYRRWSGKEELLLEALEMQAGEVPLVEVTGNLRADLATLSVSLLRHFLDPVGWATLRAAVDSAADDPPLSDFHGRIVVAHRQAAAVLFDGYVESGELSRCIGSDVMAEQLFGAVLMHVLALTPDRRQDARDNAAGHVDPIVRLFLAGARSER